MKSHSYIHSLRPFL